MVIRGGFFALAQKLQESALAMSHGDIQTRISDALRDAYRGTGNWCYLVAVFGDDKSGDCVYSCESDLKKAAYSINGATCTVDTAAAVDVLPLTTYQVEGAEVGTTEAGARNSRHDLRQLQTIHDSAASLGANCTMAESHRHAPAELKLVECASDWCDSLDLREAVATPNRSTYPVKLISPGTGTMAHYPADVLERDGPKVFKKGTLMFWNHPTAAEEAARPEGNLDHLAAILKTDAVWDAKGVKGPGLYAEAAVMADYAQKVAERAPHIGLSIRGGGKGTGKLIDGKPVLQSLDYAESVDYVTKAGRGGLALAEAAQHAGLLDAPAAAGNLNLEVPGMDPATITALQESLRLRESNEKKLLERAVRGDAREVATAALRGLSLHEAAQQMVMENVIGTAGAWRSLPVKDGELDAAVFTESVKAEAKRVGAMVSAMTGGGAVRGLGAGEGPGQTVTAEEAARQQKLQADEDARYLRVFESLTNGNKAAAAIALNGRAS